MTLAQYNKFCKSLKHSTHVVQWGGAHVWKIGTKVFAICGWTDGETPFVTFKCDRFVFDMLRDQPGLRPAPYLASRGMSWIQRTGAETMSDVELKQHLRESYRLASLNLSKKLQTKLGLNTK